MKRKNPPSSQASPAKVRRQSASAEDNSGSEDEDSRPWEEKAGMILEVHMENFMCHQVNIIYSFELPLMLMLCRLTRSNRTSA